MKLIVIAKHIIKTGIFMFVMVFISCNGSQKKAGNFPSVKKYDFVLKKYFSEEIKYNSLYYDYRNNIKYLYDNLDSNFSITSYSNQHKSEVYVVNDTIICDGYKFVKEMEIGDCLSIKYLSPDELNSSEIKFCLEEVISTFELNNLIIDTCFVYKDNASQIGIQDNYDSKVYYDFSRKIIVKEEWMNRDRIIGTLELVNEAQVSLSDLPNVSDIQPQR